MSKRQELNQDAIALMNNMAGAMNSKKKAKKAKKNKYVIIVNGVVTGQMAKTVKEITKAATTLTLKLLASGCAAPKVAFATISNTVSIKIPTSVGKIDGIRGNK